jgi:hypothetical protein
MTTPFTVFTFFKTLMTIIIIIGLSGCAINAPSKHNPGGANITVSSMQPNSDENPYLTTSKIHPLNISNITTVDRKMSFAEAHDFDDKFGFGDVEVNFSAINDKAVKGNPTVDPKWYEKRVHTSKTYTGYDNWGAEFAADLDTRMEYHLIREARLFLGEKYGNNGAYFTHHLHSRPVKSIRRPNPGDHGRLMNQAMIWLKEQGFSDKSINDYTFNCTPISYSKMMEQNEDITIRYLHWYALAVYKKFHKPNTMLSREMQHPHSTRERSYIKDLTRGSRVKLRLNDKQINEVMELSIMKRQDQCEAVKDTMMVDGFQLFPKKLPDEVENGVFKTIYIDEPRFDPSLFQNLFSKNYFGELIRVSENGAFASLRKPEGRSFIMEYNVRTNGFHYRQKEKTRLDKFGNNDALKTAAIANTWFSDTNFIHNYNVLDWSIQFKKNYSNKYNHLMDCRINNNEMNFQLNTRIRRVYNCSIRNNENKFAHSFVRLLNGHSTGGSLYATVDVEGPDFGGDAFVESKRDDYANDALFTISKPMLVSEYIEGEVLKSVPVNTAISYIQKLSNGKVEGVVHVLGYKVIFDLTDISNWYQKEMSDAYPVDKALTKWSDIHAKSKSASLREFREFTAK